MDRPAATRVHPIVNGYVSTNVNFCRSSPTRPGAWGGGGGGVPRKPPARPPGGFRKGKRGGGGGRVTRKRAACVPRWFRNENRAGGRAAPRSEPQASFIVAHLVYTLVRARTKLGCQLLKKY
eukprot:SAG31_NODE_23207_length_509_cov_0.673171_1_plen_121_part_01